MSAFPSATVSTNICCEPKSIHLTRLIFSLTEGVGTEQQPGDELKPEAGHRQLGKMFPGDPVITRNLDLQVRREQRSGPLTLCHSSFGASGVIGEALPSEVQLESAAERQGAQAESLSQREGKRWMLYYKLGTLATVVVFVC